MIYLAFLFRCMLHTFGLWKFWANWTTSSYRCCPSPTDWRNLWCRKSQNWQFGKDLWHKYWSAWYVWICLFFLNKYHFSEDIILNASLTFLFYSVCWTVWTWNGFRSNFWNEYWYCLLGHSSLSNWMRGSSLVSSLQR